MLFCCLGYHNESKSQSMPPEAMNNMVDECFTYDEQLQADGTWAGGNALYPSSMAKTVRWSEGSAVVIDGPYAETKEQIGGILMLEARDLEHAVEIMSKHPGIKQGPFEIRPIADLTGMVNESKARRAAKR